MIDKLKKYGEVKENIDLKKYNTYGIGGIAKYLVKPTSIDNLINLITYLKQNNVSFYILGSGSNVILPDQNFDGVIIRLDNLNNIDINDDSAYVDAGVFLTYLSNYLIKNGYINLTFCNGIPGTIASAIIGNVGCFKHEIYEYVEEVVILNEKLEKETLKKENIKYSYRDTEFKKRDVVILQVKLKLEKGSTIDALKQAEEQNEYRKNTQPLKEKNAGSVFRNPGMSSAGKLIDDAGLKGFSYGGAKVSEKHANFIVNYDNATSHDIITLIEKIKKIIKEKDNIDLELEQIIVKW